MNTVLVWLLISVSDGPYTDTVTVAQFVERGECERVRGILDKRATLYHPKLLCVQAHVR